MSKRFCSIVLTAVISIFAVSTPEVAAQTYPSRPITFVFPFGPGAGSDILQRAAVAEASKLLGQTIVYENRAGASNRLGIAAMNNAPPDGYTISAAIDGLLVAQPVLDPAFKMRPLEDYVPVALQFESSVVLIGSPSLPFKDIPGLLAFAKANPGKLNMGVGTASSSHILGEMIRQLAGIDITIVGYKGTSQAYNDLMAGRVHLAVATAPTLVESGKAIGLATSGRERWSSLPKLPTFNESGIPITATLWFAVLAHPKTPTDVVAKLNGAFSTAVRTPGFSKLIQGTATVVMPALRPEEIAAFIKSEIAVQEPVIRKAGIKLQ